MKNVSGIVTIALVSSLGLLAAGCDRNEESEANKAEIKFDDPVAETRQESHDLGNTLEQNANQAGQSIDDAAITTSIKTRYLADDLLKGHEISVETNSGVVMLTGKVQDYAAKEKAMAIARVVDGVVSVNNELTTN